jgi:hypothetical protein
MTLTTDQKQILMRQIAAHLPDFEYCAPVDGRQPRLVGPKGMAIYINSSDHRGKLHIHGEWPMAGHKYMSPRSWCVVPYGQDQDISINVSIERGPDVIAREIMRRFLGSYRDLYEQCLARKAEHDAYRNRAHATACQLATVAGISSPGIGEDQTQYTLHIGNVTTRGWYGDARCNADSVDLKLQSLSPEIAAQVLHLVYAATPKTEATAA